MTLICQVVQAARASDCVDEAREAFADGADMVELRVDMMDDPSTEELAIVRDGIGGPLMGTFRTVDDSGKDRMGGTAGRASEVLAAMIELGFDLVDIELPLDPFKTDLLEKAAEAGVQVVLSDHMAAVPRSLDDLDIAMDDIPQGVILKTVAPVDSMEGLEGLRRLARSLYSSGIPHITLASGPFSWVQRMTAPLQGCELCFCTANGRQRLEGLPSVGDLRAAYGSIMLCDRDPGSHYALIGGEVSRSPSPGMFNKAFADSGMNAAYLPFSVADPGDLRGFLGDPLSYGIVGGNATMPYKKALLEAAGRRTAAAERAGAANCFKVQTTAGMDRENGSTIEVDNTDSTALMHLMENAGPKALLLGCGGAAGAAGAALSELGLATHVWCRDTEAAQRTALGFGEGFEAAPEDVTEGTAAYDVLVNCTPLGADGGPDPPQWMLSLAKNARLVVDAAYRAGGTPLINAAAAAGAQVRSGGQMLLGQAKDGFLFLTGSTAPDSMAEVLVEVGLLDGDPGDHRDPAARKDEDPGTDRKEDA